MLSVLQYAGPEQALVGLFILEMVTLRLTHFTEKIEMWRKSLGHEKGSHLEAGHKKAWPASEVYN